MSNGRAAASGEHWALVANGEIPAGAAEALIGVLDKADCVVAVDGGLRHCLALGVRPTILIGDLDSADPKLVDQARSSGTTVHEFPADKDATDLELALEMAATAGASSVTVLAAFGGRLDHELATLSLLAAHRWSDLVVTATDGARHVHVVRDHCALDAEPGITLSLLPWHGPVYGVTTEGLKWPLTDATLAPGTTHGVSNVAVDPVQQVAISQGVLLVIIDTAAEQIQTR